MNLVIRMFALFVAVAGLASAAFAPPTRALNAQASMYARGPVIPNLPGPLPCQFTQCFAPTTLTR